MHPPAVAVELRQRVEVHVSVTDAEVPTERRGVEPDVAVGDLHAFRAGGRAGGVVDRRRGVLVGRPRLWLDTEAHHLLVGVAADHEAALAGHVGQRVVQLGVDEQQPGTRVLDDVAHLLGGEAEVDRHEDASRPRHAVHRGHQPGRVVADDRHPLADPDAELVQPGGHRPRPLGHLPVRERVPRLGGLVRLVDDPDAIGVQQLGAVDEVVDGEGHLHGSSFSRLPGHTVDVPNSVAETGSSTGSTTCAAAVWVVSGQGRWRSTRWASSSRRGSVK